MTWEILTPFVAVYELWTSAWEAGNKRRAKKRAATAKRKAAELAASKQRAREWRAERKRVAAENLASRIELARAEAGEFDLDLPDDLDWGER